MAQNYLKFLSFLLFFQYLFAPLQAKIDKCKSTKLRNETKYSSPRPG